MAPAAASRMMLHLPVGPECTRIPRTISHPVRMTIPAAGLPMVAAAVEPRLLLQPQKVARLQVARDVVGS